ncbi:MAG: hypothetical protein BJ554DRAFT_3790 [Olpidium bornovanus]|uniref:Uncharacterized protein n=1 Tax=Olpidium bornovanus TaxID=278681 RepID=A0A8H7ZNX3_9FUNG|nr:MAG: hypothetical protein BJ554DRAFT_3790 [Olpidium bornovanus]
MVRCTRKANSTFQRTSLRSVLDLDSATFPPARSRPRSDMWCRSAPIPAVSNVSISATSKILGVAGDVAAHTGKQDFEVYENSPKKGGGYLGQSIQHLSAPSSPSKITGLAGRDNGSHDEDGEGEKVTTPHRRSSVTIGKSRPRRLERSLSKEEMPVVEDLPSSTTAVLGKPPPLRNRSLSTRRRRDSSLPRRSPTPTASSARRQSTPASVAKPALRRPHHHHQLEDYGHDVEYDSSNAANDSSGGDRGAGRGAGDDAGRRTPLSGSGGGGGGAASVDGREFFRMARGVLSYDEVRGNVR